MIIPKFQGTKFIIKFQVKDLKLMEKARVKSEFTTN